MTDTRVQDNGNGNGFGVGGENCGCQRAEEEKEWRCCHALREKTFLLLHTTTTARQGERGMDGATLECKIAHYVHPLARSLLLSQLMRRLSEKRDEKKDSMVMHFL